jgi:hypothetical protein
LDIDHGECPLSPGKTHHSIVKKCTYAVGKTEQDEDHACLLPFYVAPPVSQDLDEGKHHQQEGRACQHLVEITEFMARCVFEFAFYIHF